MNWKTIQSNEAAPGFILMGCAVLALLVANSPLSDWYDSLIQVPLSVTLGGAGLQKPILLWINDGLMALFFLLVGIELKHELMFGHLRNRQQIALPAAAAIGGMVVPAIIYLAFTWSDPIARNGWAIPAATDIAFALAVFAMLAKHLPSEVKIFLLAIAIIDDIGAILIIALLYTADLSVISLLIAAALTGVLVLLNRKLETSVAPFMIIGTILWVATLKSGVHATLAGVAVGLALPLTVSSADKVSAGYRVEHGLKPWVYFLVLPLFALANAGVNLQGTAIGDVLTPVVLGVAAGLLIGKPLGVLAAVWIAETVLGIKRPAMLTWPVVAAVGCLCGIGFTMSLFVGSLAFEHAPDMNLGDERVGILVGSILAATLASLVLRSTRPASDRGTH